MSVIFRLLAAFSLVLTIPVSAHAQIVDRTDPAATAQAFLTAYTSRDLEALAILVNRNNRKAFRRLADEGESNIFYDSIFTAFYPEAEKNWTEDSGDVRYTHTLALVHISTFSGSEVFYLVLTFEEGQWGFENFGSLPRSRFEDLPTVPSARD